MSGLIDFRVAKRHHSSNRQGRYRLWFMAAAAGIIGAATPSLWHMSKESELLKIHHINVEGTTETRSEEIRRYAETARGRPIHQLDLGEVGRRVEEHPFIKTATVRWLPPDVLNIRVAERKPALAVVLGKTYLADEDGELFKRRSLAEKIDLPVVTGLEGAGQEREQQHALLLSLRLVEAHQEAGAPGGAVQQIHHDDGGITLTLEEGLDVRLPAGDLEKRMATLATLLHRLAQAGHHASWIHLNDARRPERVAVRLRAMSEVASGG